MTKLAAALTALAVTAPLVAFAQEAAVNVTVNGQPVTFDQPPVQRIGRVYVPLRGVFERLGATVVYQAGAIAATRGATTVSLRVGSPSAVVNGATTTLDAAPFTIGARVLVPLRFVAQALGATVNYDGSSRSVAIGQPGQAPPPPPNAVLTPAPAPARLLRMQPASNETVSTQRPQIAATFPRAVDPNTVRVSLDGRDVTAESSISPRAISYDPSFDLPYGRHQVSVTAPGVASTWAFVNQSVQNANFLRNVSPPNGAAVGLRFTVQGYTRPDSRVHIVVQTSSDASGDTAQSTVTTDSGADPNGHFARQITIDGSGASVIDVRLESHAPDGAVAVRTLRLRP